MMNLNNKAQMHTASSIVVAIFCQRLTETFVLKLEAILMSVYSCVYLEHFHSVRFAHVPMFRSVSSTQMQWE